MRKALIVSASSHFKFDNAAEQAHPALDDEPARKPNQRKAELAQSRISAKPN